MEALSGFQVNLAGNVLLVIFNILFVGATFGFAIRFCSPDCDPFVDGVLAGAVRSALFGIISVVLLLVSLSFGCFAVILWIALFFGGMRLVFGVGAFRTVLIVIVFIILEAAVHLIIGGIMGAVGGGGSEDTPKTNSASDTLVPLRQQEWTAGFGDKDILNWKGQAAGDVVKFFGRPDHSDDLGQGKGRWTYFKMNIKDKKGEAFSSLSFIIENGTVVEIEVNKDP